MEKFRTSKMKDRLRDEESDLIKQKKRDGNNVLLSSNMKKIIQEESKTNSNLSQVGTAWHNEHRHLSTSDYVSSGGEEALQRRRLRQEAQLRSQQGRRAPQGQEGQNPQVSGGGILP